MSFSRGRWPECKADRSPQSSVDVKNARRYTSIPLKRFHVSVLAYFVLQQSQIFGFSINSTTQDSSVSIMTRLQDAQPRNIGSIAGKGYRFFSFPKRPDRLWGPHSLLFDRNRGLFRQG